MMFYQYWIVRYVPDAIRGEFVNIALLVGGDGQDWAFRRVTHLQRATRLGGDPTIAGYWLRELESMVSSLNHQRVLGSEPILTALADSGENISAAVVGRLAARLNNAVQISAPYPIVAETAQAGISMLFDHLVDDPQVKSRELFGARVSSYVSQQFRRALPEGSQAVIRNRPYIRVGGVPRTANFAVTDSEVEQITNTWSFNLSDVEKVSTEIQAWVAHMNRLRRRGGVLESKGGPPLTIPGDVQLRVVYEEPRLDSARPALQIAKEVWSEVPGLVAYPEAEQSRLITDALAVVA
jgi:hypothetical protein